MNYRTIDTGNLKLAIKIEMLRCFHAVVEQGSLASAAEVLARTPSAVSMMLKQFEDHIGGALFESARKSRLTPLGEAIFAEAQRELAHFDRTVSAIEGLSQAKTGHVRLSATPSVAQTIMPPILRKYMVKHSGVHVDMSDTDSGTVQRDLLSGRADIGLASLPPMAGFDRELLFSDAYGVVCTIDHPLAQDWTKLTWADIEGIDFIANGLCQHINDPDFQPILQESRLMVRNTASILSMVRAGVGVTILPELSILPDFMDLEFLPLANSTARREVWMVTQPRKLLTPATRALADEIRSADLTRLSA